MYAETDEQVHAEIQGYLAQVDGAQAQMVIRKQDAKKFKDGIDPSLVLKMLTWMGEGFMNEIIGKTEREIDIAAEPFDKIINTLRRNFLKEEA